jgi:type IV pilus assembly protein PilV
MISINVTKHRNTQSGFSMIEVLVTLLIISLALLGTAGLQAHSMRLNQGGQFRTQAVFLAADLAERMEANKPGAMAGSYAMASSSSANTISTACVTNACSATDLAAYDLSQWQNAVAVTLPQSSWTVVNPGGSPSTVTITISWVDRRTDTTNAAATASSPVGSNDAGTGEKFSYTATRTILN